MLVVSRDYDDEEVPDSDKSLGVLLAGLLLQALGEQSDKEGRGVVATAYSFILYPWSDSTQKLTFECVCRSGAKMEIRRSST
jgi:hypothetical protein